MESLLLFQVVCDSYRTEDGEQCLLDGVETAFEDARQTPCESGVCTETVAEIPVGTDIKSKLPLAQVLAEVVVAALAHIVSQFHFLAYWVVLAQITVVGMSLEVGTADV